MIAVISSEHRIVQYDRGYILGEQDSMGEILLAMTQWSNVLLMRKITMIGVIYIITHPSVNVKM